MKKKLGIPDNRPLADFCDTVIIKTKDFSAAMTAYNIQSDDLYGVDKITQVHIINNKAVRETLVNRGIYPEDIPAREDVRKVRAELGKERLDVLQGDTNSLSQIDEGNNSEREITLYQIDISKDLWKIALLIAASKPAGIVSTKELQVEIPNYIIVPQKYLEYSEIKKEPKINQVIRNLKSNKNNKTSMFSNGYAIEVKDGFQITEKGLHFIQETFKDFLNIE